MNYIDIILCIPLVWGLYKGFTKGLIVEVATIVAFGLGVWGGIHFSNFISRKITEWFDWHSKYLPIISFAITFLGIVILVYFIAKVIQGMLEGVALSAVNKIGGAIFGTLKFALIMSVVIFMMDALEESYPMISFKTKEESLLYKPIGEIAPFIIPSLKASPLHLLSKGEEAITKTSTEKQKSSENKFEAILPLSFGEGQGVRLSCQRFCSTNNFQNFICNCSLTRFVIR